MSVPVNNSMPSNNPMGDILAPYLLGTDPVSGEMVFDMSLLDAIPTVAMPTMEEADEAMDELIRLFGLA